MKRIVSRSELVTEYERRGRVIITRKRWVELPIEEGELKC